jgi:hypothetical protein
MKRFRPYVPPSPALKRIKEEDECQWNALQKCSDPNCSKQHGIGLVKASGTTIIRPAINVLTETPRDPPSEGPLFDIEGPETLNSFGSRHNNDELSIDCIQILPTTDEVSSPPNLANPTVYLPNTFGEYFSYLETCLKHKSGHLTWLTVLFDLSQNGLETFLKSSWLAASLLDQISWMLYH